MRVLGLDAALSQCAAALVVDGHLRGECVVPLRQGHPAALPEIVQSALDAAGLEPSELDLIAVTVGPGSFTGIRSALAFAQGLAIARRVPVIGVTVGEAFAVSLRHIIRRELWAVIDSGRTSGVAKGLGGTAGGQPAGGSVRVFLERHGETSAVSLDALPRPTGPIAIAGNVAAMAAARLAAQGYDVLLTDLRIAGPREVALAGHLRWSGGGGISSARPLYVDMPAARLPAGGLRPAPAA
jgi:tRNA threonylcarbamoyl adenosine modification protein YeaZ